MGKIKVKICGITNLNDRGLVVKAGADFFGAIIDHPASPRSLPLKEATALFFHPPINSVAVTVDRDEYHNKKIINSLSPHAIQLHGDEPPKLIRALKALKACQVWKVIHLPPAEEQEAPESETFSKIYQYLEAGVDKILLDTVVARGGKRLIGGTGRASNWQLASKIISWSTVDCFLAGGLRPDNIIGAINTAQPYGIDVSSGVEARAGIKDPLKIRHLFGIIKSLST